MSSWATADPVPESQAGSPTGSDSTPRAWSLPRRIAFRFAFCYLGGYCLCNGNATALGLIPFAGDFVQRSLARAFQLPAQYLAQHLFHIAPPGDHLHPTGSGDTAIHWIVVLLMLCASLVATAVWSVLDRRRANYRTLDAWLRFLARFTVGVGMVAYGFNKVFPMQMGPPSVFSLSEPLGMHSPMTLLWEFIGLHPLYEMVCGAAELLAGLLLLFRRTALAGAILATFVLANVLLYNLFFDVPVKLYAGHLLLLSIFLILPDVTPLFRFFFLHKPAAPAAPWAPPANRRWSRRTLVGVEIAFTVLVLGGGLLGNLRYWRGYRQRNLAQCDLCRAWKLQPSASPLPSPFNAGAVELAINSPTWAIVLDAAGKATSIQIQTDAAHHTLEFEGPGKAKSLFLATQPDPHHLTLTPTGNNAAITLTDATPPDGYLLLDRGFHWVSEFPYLR